MRTLLIRMRLVAIIVASLAVTTAACGPAPSSGTDAAAEVTAMWTEAFNAGDPAALTTLYAEDARSMPPGGPALAGRDEIESYWRGDIGEGGATTTLTPTDVLVQGDVLHVEGRYEVEGEDDIGLAGGQFHQLWTRDGGQWQLRREMWRIDPALHREMELADRLTSSWAAAYNAGDAEALTALYSEDGALSTAQEGSFSGKMAIEAFWTRDLAGTKPSSTLALTDVYATGELVHLEGDYKVTEGRSTTEGRYIQLWMREGNTWRIHREMWWR